MAATKPQLLVALILLIATLVKLALYVALLITIIMGGVSLFRSGDALSSSSSYFVISGLLWARTSIEDSIWADVAQVRKQMYQLLFEEATLVETSRAYMNLGLWMNWSGTGGVLQSTAWHATQNGKPEYDLWQLPFCITVVFGGTSWHVTQYIDVVGFLKAWLWRQPVVFIWFESGQDKDGWKSGSGSPKFMLAATTRSSICRLLDDATFIADSEEDVKCDLSSKLLRYDARSGDYSPVRRQQVDNV